LIAQIIIASALLLATLWYAYNTMELSKQQRRTHSLNQEIWRRKSTPKIWFSLARLDITKICLIVTNLGGDVGVNIEAEIETETVEFPWKWPSILPKEQEQIELPYEISNINNLDMMGYLKITFKYSDSESCVYEDTQEIDPKLMSDGLKGHQKGLRRPNC
jgi:hypothetical protein